MVKIADIKLGQLDTSYQETAELPLDTLSPDALARLRAGGQLTEADLTALRTAAAQQGSMGAQLLAALLASGDFKMRTVSESVSELPIPAEPGTVVVAGPTQVFEWRATQDSHRPVSVATHRTINWAVTAVAAAIPIGLIALGVASGKSLETIATMAIGGAAIALILMGAIAYALPSGRSSAP